MLHRTVHDLKLVNGYFWNFPFNNNPGWKLTVGTETEEIGIAGDEGLLYST